MYLKLKNLRLEHKYTTAFMADALGISKPFYSQIESGKRRLSYDMAIRIAKVFKTKPDNIFYEDHLNNKK